MPIQMIARWSIFALFLASIAPLSGGDLLLLAGSPTPKHNQAFQSILYSLQEGTLSPLLELSDAGVPTEWIGVTSDHGLAVLVTRWPSSSIAVIDLKRSAIVKRCAPPKVGASLIEQWLLDLPLSGIAYVQYLAEETGFLRAMTLDPTKGCEESFVPAHATDVRFLHSDGAAGVADMGSFGGMVVRLTSVGQITRRLAPEFVVFDQKVPFETAPVESAPLAMIAINNRSVLAVTFNGARRIGEREDVIAILRKRDKRWIKMPRLGQLSFWIRGFGSYVTLVEADLASPSRQKNRDTRAIVGQVRQKGARTGPSVHQRLTESGTFFPGRLHIFNVETERVYTIETGNSDSEVLLVHSEVVYYRVGERLYSARIGDKSLDTPKLEAESAALVDVHWAFAKE